MENVFPIEKQNVKISDMGGKQLYIKEPMQLCQDSTEATMARLQKLTGNCRRNKEVLECRELKDTSMSNTERNFQDILLFREK